MTKGKTHAQGPVLVPVSADCEGWPYLPPELLRPSRSRQVCMTCHWFRHHAGPSCITLLCCQLHQGLISQGDHLKRRCPHWSESVVLRQGWAPEMGRGGSGIDASAWSGEDVTSQTAALDDW